MGFATLVASDLEGGGRRYATRPAARSVRSLGLQLAIFAAAAAALAGAGASREAVVAGSAVVLAAAAVHRMLVVTEESMAVRQCEGLELRTRRAYGRVTVRRIEYDDIADIFIAEAVRVDRCFNYLAVLLKGDGKEREAQLAAPFKVLRPRLADLQLVVNGAREELWPKGEPPPGVAEEVIWAEARRARAAAELARPDAFRRTARYS